MNIPERRCILFTYFNFFLICLSIYKHGHCGQNMIEQNTHTPHETPLFFFIIIFLFFFILFFISIQLCVSTRFTHIHTQMTCSFGVPDYLKGTVENVIIYKTDPNNVIYDKMREKRKRKRNEKCTHKPINTYSKLRISTVQC